ncbi:MAG TPA: DMT family transporter [Gemmatimonadaceae bacterium]|jgi:drug/metabolite transporter (DMT)-like permease|nr:DMT family transporter [Gemmatimonadaceae bacterium]
MSAKPYWVLVLALLGISFAGPLVRLSTADAVTIAVWRLGFSLIIVTAFLVITGEWRDWRHLTPRHFGFAVLGGVCLALHFWAWNASIHLTTIAASVTLVGMQPAIVAVISAFALREAPTRRQVAGIAIAIIGATIIAAPDLKGGLATRGNAPLLGNLLATSGAVTAAIYYSIGRSLRKTLGVWAYVGIVYTAAFVTLWFIARSRGAALTPQPPREIAIFAALALGPMLLGHTGMNWALKFLPAYVVNLIVLGEPIGATILGAVIPAIRQIPSAATLIGGAVVLTGVVIAAGSQRPAATTGVDN